MSLTDASTPISAESLRQVFKGAKPARDGVALGPWRAWLECVPAEASAEEEADTEKEPPGEEGDCEVPVERSCHVYLSAGPSKQRVSVLDEALLEYAGGDPIELGLSMSPMETGPKREIVIHVSYSDEPVCGSGASRITQYLWVHPLNSRVTWGSPTIRGGAPPLEACALSLKWGDANCDDRPDILADHRCDELCDGGGDEAEEPDEEPARCPSSHKRALMTRASSGAAWTAVGSYPLTMSSKSPYLAIVGSFALGARTSPTKAAARVEALKAAGFNRAEQLDSLSLPRLSCCYVTVIAGRYASRDEAKRAVAQLKAAGFKAYVRRSH